MIKFRDLDLGIREPMEVLVLAVTERETKNENRMWYFR